MRRPLFLLLLLSSALSWGCPQPRNDNAPNANATASPTAQANDNQTIAPARDPKHKAVQIAVSGNNEITIAPERLVLDAGRDQKLRFSVFNNLDVDIRLVEIIFKDDAEPFEGGRKFEVEGVAAGEEDDSKGNFRRPKRLGRFRYTVRVTLDNGTTFEEDPEIEISGRLQTTSERE